MSDLMKKMLVLVTIFFVLGTTWAVTRQVLTTAYFTVPESTQFNVWFPGNISCVSGNPGLCTTELNFSSDNTGSTKYANCSVVGSADVQNGSVPCMYIDNTGNIDLNISMKINDTEPGGESLIDLWGGTTYGAMLDGTHVDINASAYWVIDASLTPAENNITVWLWVNFSSAPGGLTQRNITIEGNTV